MSGSRAYAWDSMGQNRRGSISSSNTIAAKDRDEDLALFHDMRTRELNGFLHPTLDDVGSPLAISTTKTSAVGSKTSSAHTPTRKHLNDLLSSETDKSDYDWLLTPPGTPLFPSLDRDLSAGSAQTRLPLSSSKLSRLSSALEQSSGHPSTGHNQQQHHHQQQQQQQQPSIQSTKLTRNNPSPRRQSVLSSSTSSTSAATPHITKSRPTQTTSNRSATPNGRPSTPSSSTSSVRSSTPTRRSSTPTRTPSSAPGTGSGAAGTGTGSGSRPATPVGLTSSRPSTPTGRTSSIPSSSRPSTPTRRTSMGFPTAPAFGNGYNKLPATLPSSTRGSSPMRKGRSAQSEPPPPPPNLRRPLPDRPTSNSRGSILPSSSSSSSRSMNNVDVKKQQPSFTRSYNQDHRDGGSNFSKRAVSSTNEDSRAGSKISSSSATAAASKACGSFYGTSISKKSLDTAIRHMDIRRSSSNGFKQLVTTSPVSSFYSRAATQIHRQASNGSSNGHGNGHAPDVLRLDDGNDDDGASPSCPSCPSREGSDDGDGGLFGDGDDDIEGQMQRLEMGRINDDVINDKSMKRNMLLEEDYLKEFLTNPHSDFLR